MSRVVVVESPFAAWEPDGKTWSALGEMVYQVYLDGCLMDCILRKESPHASHGVLRVHDLCMVAKLRALYCDLGLSSGMLDSWYGKFCERSELRTLGPDWMKFGVHVHDARRGGLWWRDILSNAPLPKFLTDHEMFTGGGS